MGANAPHEIALLCEIANPTHGFITNIGKDHIEGFGSMEGVARANGELFEYLKKHNGTAYVNTLEPYLQTLSEGLEKVFTYPEPNDYFSLRYQPGGFYLSFSTADHNLHQTSLVGAYNFPNIATALCIGHSFGVPENKAIEAVCKYIPTNNRSQIVERGNNTLLLDAYNANPSSMLASLDNLKNLATDLPKWAIIGDMLELGHTSHSEHEDLGKWLKNAGFNAIFLVGEEMQFAANFCPQAQYFKTRPELENYLQHNPAKGNFILLKGSRGIGLEKLAAFL